MGRVGRVGELVLGRIDCNPEELLSLISYSYNNSIILIRKVYTKTWRQSVAYPGGAQISEKPFKAARSLIGWGGGRCISFGI